jgi:hypothetical protein
MGKQFFNFRLAPGAVSDALSDYTHNAGACVSVFVNVCVFVHVHVCERVQCHNNSQGFFFAPASEVVTFL